MAKCSSGTRFAVEAFLQHGIEFSFEFGDLDRYLAFENRVFGEIHRTHVAFAQQLAELVPAKHFQGRAGSITRRISLGILIVAGLFSADGR